MADHKIDLQNEESDEVDLWDTENKNIDLGNVHDKEQTHSFANFPDSALDPEDEGDNDATGLIERKKHAIWSFAFYQELFDVDTDVVLNRVKGSLIPSRNASFSRNYLGGKPDLYGPFWICTTLIVTILICGNLTTLLSHMNDEAYHYTPQFERLSIAAIIIYGYTSLIPLFIKGFFWLRKISSNLSYMDMMCTYGYSMFVFIPLSILLLIPSSAVDWILVCVAASVSGLVVVLSLNPAFEDVNKVQKMILLATVFAMHFALALTFRLYFFNSISLYSDQSHQTNSTLKNSLTAQPNVQTTLGNTSVKN